MVLDLRKGISRVRNSAICHYSPIRWCSGRSDAKEFWPICVFL